MHSGSPLDSQSRASLRLGRQTNKSRDNTRELKHSACRQTAIYCSAGVYFVKLSKYTFYYHSWFIHRRAAQIYIANLLTGDSYTFGNINNLGFMTNKTSRSRRTEWPLHFIIKLSLLWSSEVLFFLDVVRYNEKIW